MKTHTKEDLAKLLDFIAGRGEWAHYGGGIWTDPDAGESEQFKHSACEELERRGLIRRKLDEADLCIWEANQVDPD